jgi:Co/Zn/Cd efflux system component
MNQIGTTTVVTPDVENSSVLAVTSLDPYQFRRGLKSENELYKLRRTSRGRHLVEYHRKQNELITSLLKPMETHTEEAKAEETKARLPVRIAVWSSLVANVTLSGLQLYAAITSGSLSFLATALDSVFDPASNVALYWLHKKSQRLDLRKWPVGGVRLETVGNIVYSFLMAAVNLVIIVESLQDIFSHKADDPLKAFYLPAVISVAIALGTKLALFFYCFSIRKHSSQVQVLWEDHRNDLFINGFGLLMSIGGSKWAWWLDPSGGLIVRFAIIVHPRLIILVHNLPFVHRSVLAPFSHGLGQYTASFPCSSVDPRQKSSLGWSSTTLPPSVRTSSALILFELTTVGLIILWKSTSSWTL